MRKAISIMLIIVFAISVMSACMNNGDSKYQNRNTRTIIDMQGTEVQIPQVVNNYASVFAGNFDLFAMLDGCKHMSTFSETVLKYEHVLKAYPELKSKIALPRRNVSTESIIESGAQVVILRENDYPELTRDLRAMGVPVVDMNFENFEDLKKCVTLFANIINTDEVKAKAKKYNKYLDNNIKLAAEFRENNHLNTDVSVLALRDADDLEAYSPDRMMDSWASACGFNYCLKSAPGNQNLKLTPEQMLQFDPDYIIFVFDGNAEKFMQNEKMATLSAVKNNRVYQSPTVFNPFVVSGVEVALQMQWMYAIVYSDIIDYDMVQITKDFYDEFFGYEMDDETITTLLGIEG